MVTSQKEASSRNNEVVPASVGDGKKQAQSRVETKNTSEKDTKLEKTEAKKKPFAGL